MEKKKKKEKGLKIKYSTRCQENRLIDITSEIFWFVFYTYNTLPLPNTKPNEMAVYGNPRKS